MQTLAATLGALAECVITTTPDERITFLNRAAERLTGWSAHEAQGQTVDTVLRFEGESPLRAAIERGGGAPVPRGARAYVRDGFAYVDGSAAAILDGDDHVLGGLLLVRDVTDRRRAESRARHLQAAHRALLEVASDGIVVLSLDGTILEINRKAARMRGASPEELVGRDYLAYVPILARGSVCALDIRSSLVDLGDERVVLVVERDLADSERAGAQLQQIQRLGTIGTLTGGVAHDFNNVLAAIIANSDFLLAEMPEGDPRREDADEIKRIAQRGAALTKQLLAFSRSERSEPRIVELGALIRDLNKMLCRLLGEDIALELALGAEGATVLADPSQLEQVVMNLVVNARDAMPRGGRLRITTREDGEHVVLSVIDTGAGMDAQTQQRMFEPFFTTKESGKGTGLGLPIAYGIVKQLGGRIEVTSEPGDGTTFDIYLPRARAARITSESEAPMPDSHGHELVLLVEDDEPLRSTLQRVLRAHGYRVLAAGDGHAAIAAAAEHGPEIALCVCDAIIPGPSGAELLAQLDHHAPAARVLFMSGYSDHAVLRDDVLAPRLELLQKPFSASDFATSVRRVLDKL